MKHLYEGNEDIKLTTSKPVTDSRTELLNKIKSTFQDEYESREYMKYFTTGKGVISISLDNSSIKPNGATLLGGKNISEKYMKQLEKMLFSKEDEINFDKMVTLIMYFKLILDEKYPIKITTIKYKKKLPLFCKVINDFYNKHYAVLDSIHTMLNGSFSVPEKVDNEKIKITK